MPDPISVSLLVSGLTAVQFAARSGTAISTMAQAVQRAAATVVRSTERSQALFGTKADLISRMWALLAECADVDWDGNDAAPLSYGAVVYAAQFIRALPDGVPLPELAPEPDGSISLDWIQSRHCLFSLSIGASDRFPYAWVDGTDKGHGVSRFDGVTIPARIVAGIQAIVKTGNAALRPL